MWINNGPIDMNGNAIDYDDTIIYKNSKYDILRMITWKDDDGPHWKLHVKCLKKFSNGKYMRNDVIDVYPDMVEVDNGASKLRQNTNRAVKDIIDENKDYIIEESIKRVSSQIIRDKKYVTQVKEI